MKSFIVGDHDGGVWVKILGAVWNMVARDIDKEKGLRKKNT
jgi:hypothetical protein